MRLFGIDISEKYIFFEHNEKRYSVHFKSSLIKGIYDVSIWDEMGKTDAKVTGVYPPLSQIIQDFRQIYFPLWWQKIIRHLRYNNQ